MKISATCIALSLNNEQYSYFGIDEVIGHLGVQMHIGNKGSLFLCFSMR